MCLISGLCVMTSSGVSIIDAQYESCALTEDDDDGDDNDDGCVFLQILRSM